MKRLIHIILLFLITHLASAISLSDLLHDPNKIFYVNASAGEIKLRAKKGSVTEARVIIDDAPVKMNIAYRDVNFDYFRAAVNPFDTSVAYYFLLKDANDSLRFPATHDFRTTAQLFTTPDWAKGKVYYSIFVDGFYNGDKTNDPEETATWGSKPREWLSYGGDLKGILKKIAYLDSLNPDIIILQPIFTASSNHKFNPKDYATVDPAFGDTVDLKNLINEVHKRGKKIILSVIFSHTGIDYPMFNDIQKNGADSKYTDWYLLESSKIRTSPPNYACWRSDYRFPILNLRNPMIKNYLIGYLEYWNHFGFDGFYIGEDEKFDPVFVSTMHVNLKSRYPDILLLGSDNRLLTGNTFDGATNKNLSDILISYFVNQGMSTSDFYLRIQKLLFFNPPQANITSLLTLSDYSKRIYDPNKIDLIKNLYAFVFTCVGSPVILYGDEIGLYDYALLNPGSFNWNTKTQDRNLLNEIKKLIKIRKGNPQILSNNFYTLYINDITKVYAYDRGGLIVIINSGDRPSFVELPAWDGAYTDLILGEKVTAYSQKLKLSVNSKSYRILKREF
jgi:cyclomaltodextrinase